MVKLFFIIVMNNLFSTTFIMVFVSIIIIAYIYLRIRQIRVKKFRDYIYDLCSQKDSNVNVWFVKYPSESDMLISFKPLKLKNWIPKELLDTLLK